MCVCVCVCVCVCMCVLCALLFIVLAYISIPWILSVQETLCMEMRVFIVCISRSLKFYNRIVIVCRNPISYLELCLDD